MTVSEHIVQSLASGPISKEALRDSVMRRARCTKQGYHKALRELTRDETVTSHGQAVSLSYMYIHKQQKLLATIERAYGLPAYQAYFSTLQEGQKNTYNFKTLGALELFWTHIVIVLLENELPDVTILSLVPHDWFELLRPHTSDLWDDRLGKAHKHCMVHTHATAKEKQFAQHTKITNLETLFNENPLRQAEDTYINVIGDYIFEATFDPKSVAYISKAMRTGKRELPEACLHEKGRYKLKIQRNAQKAKTIKAKVAKYFTYDLK